MYSSRYVLKVCGRVGGGGRSYVGQGTYYVYLEFVGRCARCRSRQILEEGSVDFLFVLRLKKLMVRGTPLSVPSAARTAVVAGGAAARTALVAGGGAVRAAGADACGR